jgi:hypothetical protein
MADSKPPQNGAENGAFDVEYQMAKKPEPLLDHQGRMRSSTCCRQDLCMSAVICSSIYSCRRRRLVRMTLHNDRRPVLQISRSMMTMVTSLAKVRPGSNAMAKGCYMLSGHTT